MYKQLFEKLFLIIGTIGALIDIFGLVVPNSHLYYLVGSVLLLLTALYFKLTYFIALELILISGHGAILLGMGPIYQILIPVLLCTQFLLYYLLSGQFKNIFRLIGIIGIALFSIAFAYENQWILLFGSLSIAIFSFHQAKRGLRAALLWAFLNSIFVIIALYQILY